MTQTPEASVEPTQADREAAANIASIVRDQTFNSKYVCDGLRDDHRVVQEFARHRLASQTPPATQPSATVGATGEAITAAAKRMVAVQGMDWAELDGGDIGYWESLASEALATLHTPPPVATANYPDNTYTPYGRRSVANLAELLGIAEQGPSVVSVINAAYDEIVFRRALSKDADGEAPTMPDPGEIEFLRKFHTDWQRGVPDSQLRRDSDMWDECATPTPTAGER